MTIIGNIKWQLKQVRKQIENENKTVAQKFTLSHKLTAEWLHSMCQNDMTSCRCHLCDVCIPHSTSHVKVIWAGFQIITINTESKSWNEIRARIYIQFHLKCWFLFQIEEKNKNRFWLHFRLFNNIITT